MNRNLKIECDCGGLFKSNMVPRTSSRDSTVSEIGILCPHCNLFTISYWEDESIIGLREALVETGRNANKGNQERRLHAATLDNFSRQFDALQKRMS